jgi:hypothetical protein
MSFSIRRRLSSIIAPFTVAGPSAAPTHPVNRTGRARRASQTRHGSDDQDLSYEGTHDDWDRKSYDLSETASRRSFDASGSDGSSDSDTQRPYSGSSDYSSGSESEGEVEIGDKYDLMASHLYQVAEGKGWFRSTKAWGNSTGIVSIR